MKTTRFTTLLALFATALLSACGGDDPSTNPNPNPGAGGASGGSGSGTGTVAMAQLRLADPTIFPDDDGTYYLYGTSSDSGFEVYKSTDLVTWEGPCGKTSGGYCLVKGSSYGSKWFWAPQVFKRGDTYYMAYCADEHLAIATSDSPMGPFRQQQLAQIPAGMREIDPFVFFDDDGKTYMYHVREVDSNSIYVGEMNADLTKIDESTVELCIKAAPEGWENTDRRSWGVAEGPTVVKLDGTYYMFYSCNDYQLPTYAVGVATAKSPTGPWTKPAAPIISRDNIGQNGTGHGDLFRDKDGHWQYVFHTHNNSTTVQTRKTAIVQLEYTGTGFKVADGTFRYLMHK